MRPVEGAWWGVGTAALNERVEVRAAHPHPPADVQLGSEPWSIQFRTVCWFSLRIRAMSATVRNSSPLVFTETAHSRPTWCSRLKPLAVPPEMQRPELLARVPDQVALADHHLLSAVGLDALTTFAAKRSQKLHPRRDRFIYRRSSRERARDHGFSQGLITRIPKAVARRHTRAVRRRRGPRAEP